MGSNIFGVFILLSLASYYACKVTPPEARYELGIKLNWENKTSGQDPHFKIGKLHNEGVSFDEKLKTDLNGANGYIYALLNDTVSTISTINKQFYFEWGQTPRLNGFMEVSNIIVWEKSFINNQLIAKKEKVFKPIWTQIWARIPMRFRMTSSGGGNGNNGGGGSGSGTENDGDANNEDETGDKDYKSCVVSVSIEFNSVSTYVKTYQSNVSIAITDYLKFEIDEVWLSVTQNMATEKLSEYPFSIQNHVGSNLSVSWNSIDIPLGMVSVMLNELCDGQQTFARKFVPKEGEQVLPSGNEQVLNLDCGTGLKLVNGECQYKPCNEMDCGPNKRCEEGIEFVPTRCKCRKDFIDEGDNCTHICDTNQHGCGGHSYCARDVAGDGWECKCDDGYKVDGDRNCVEVICDSGLKLVKSKCQTLPCNEMTCGPNEHCKEGSVDEPSTCECINDNFIAVGEGCTHICNTSEHRCGNHSSCIRDATGDDWTCACNDGYALDKDKLNCVKVPECGPGLKFFDGDCQPKPCDEMMCKSDGETCVEGSSGKPSICICKNEFFKPVGEECVHICKTNQHGCRENSICIKYEDNDNFTCPCADRFVDIGSGKCIPELCPFGWRRNIQTRKCVKKTCQEMFPNECPLNEECREPDSKDVDIIATCSCKEGYHKETINNNNNNVCVIDTCESIKACGDNEVCTESDSEKNIPAKCDCGPGFKPSHLKGTRICVPF